MQPKTNRKASDFHSVPRSVFLAHIFLSCPDERVIQWHRQNAQHVHPKVEGARVGPFTVSPHFWMISVDTTPNQKTNGVSSEPENKTPHPGKGELKHQPKPPIFGGFHLNFWRCTIPVRYFFWIFPRSSNTCHMLTRVRPLISTHCKASPSIC